MYLNSLQNIIKRLFMYGKYICATLADWINGMIKPSHKYEAIPKQIIVKEENEEGSEAETKEGSEAGIKEGSEAETKEGSEAETKEGSETETKEVSETETKEGSYTDLSISWQCNQCDAFNHKHTETCRNCKTHKEIQQVLEEIILKVYEMNIGLYEQSMNLTHSPNTTTINRMAVAYKTDTNEEASMSLDLTEWACIEKE